VGTCTRCGTVFWGGATGPEIIAAVNQPSKLKKINLPQEYLEAAGQHARRRVVAAGLRIAALLDGESKP